MDANGNFQQIGGKDDNPNFPDGPIGNLGAGLGNNSNQYVWRYGEHNGELYIGTYDTSTLTYQFTQITDGKVANMDYADISGRADVLKDAVLEVLQQHDNPYLNWVLDNVLFTKYTASLYQKLAGFATDMSADKNPVPAYREMLADYEAFKEKVEKYLNIELSAQTFTDDYAEQTGIAVYSADPQSLSDLKDSLRKAVQDIFAALDKAVYDETIHNFVFYFGCNYYAQQSENGFDLLVSNDGVNFDAITRDGFGDASNHGLRTICSTENGVYMGTANPYYGTQLWRMYSNADKPLVKEDHVHVWSDDVWSADGEHHWHECTVDGCTVTDNADKDGYGDHVYSDDHDTTCDVCGYQRTLTDPDQPKPNPDQPDPDKPNPGQPDPDQPNPDQPGTPDNPGGSGNTGDTGNTGNTGNTGSTDNGGKTTTGDKGVGMWAVLAAACGASILVLTIPRRRSHGKREAR